MKDTVGRDMTTTKEQFEQVIAICRDLFAKKLKDYGASWRIMRPNVQVSLIESEKLFSALVKNKLDERKAAGTYKGKFSALHHFFGYEGRCAFPSNFDADYCYSLGYNAFMLIQYGYNGYLSKVSNLSKPAEEWVAGGMPITKMMNMERRNGEDKPVIKKALVDLEGKPFKYFEAHRDEWAVETAFTYPGAIQYYGPAEVCDLTTRTLALEKGE